MANTGSLHSSPDLGFPLYASVEGATEPLLLRESHCQVLCSAQKLLPYSTPSLPKLENVPHSDSSSFLPSESLQPNLILGFACLFLFHSFSSKCLPSEKQQLYFHWSRPVTFLRWLQTHTTVTEHTEKKKGSPLANLIQSQKQRFSAIA